VLRTWFGQELVQKGGRFLSVGTEEPDSSELARGIVDLIADKKGSDIVLLDIRRVSLLADYFVICSGDSERQLRAILDEILEKVKKERGIVPLNVEGVISSGWVLVDYGSVIVHIFAPSLREYYSLEKLWSEGTMVVRVQ
jgi:ribosome-associated protein